jgi:hypothetical protein
VTDLVEPPKPYDPGARRGTWQPPAMRPGDVARIRNAAHLAKTVFPGQLGEWIHDELKAWCDGGQTFGGGGRMLAIADDIEARHRALVLGVTYG